MTDPLPKTLFVGRGSSATAWYRCALPALALGFEWIGAAGDPDDFGLMTGMTPRRLTFADFADYDVVVLQQPCGPAWIRGIRALQEQGVTVLFEIDDYVQAIRKMEDHDFAGAFDKERAAAYELAMSVCDGVVVSTEWLASRYRAFNKHVWVCRNGLDLKRYAMTPAPRDHVTIGWAGGTGHREAARPWMAAVADVMRARPEACLMTVGQPFAAGFVAEFGPERALALPFSDLYAYPAAMSNFDIALAPAGKGNFFRGKSDLRWLEAGALGIPAIADPVVYPEIEPGVTGLHAETPAEVRDHLLALVDDARLRRRIGAAARAYVSEHRSVQAMAPQWAAMLGEAAGLRGRAAAAV